MRPSAGGPGAFSLCAKRLDNIQLTCNSGPQGLAWFVPSEATSTNHDNRNCQVELVVRCLLLFYNFFSRPSSVYAQDVCRRSSLIYDFAKSIFKFCLTNIFIIERHAPDNPHFSPVA